MFKALIGLSIAIVPFAILPMRDMRLFQVELAVCLALLTGLSGLFTQTIKPVANIFLFLLVGYLGIHAMISPKPDIQLFGMAVENFWMYKPLFYILSYFILIYAISGMQLSHLHIKLILNMMMYAGLIQAVYCILQFFYIDQLFGLNHHDPIGRVAGFLGNPTLVAQFIALTVPLTLYNKKIIYTVIMLIAIAMTDSQMAFVAVTGGVLVYYAMKSKRSMKFAISLMIAICLFLSLGGMRYFNDSSRFEHWTKITKEVNTPIDNANGQSFPLTGVGIGSFAYTYHIKNHNNYQQAHNDYLEWLFNTGLIGLALLLLSIIWMLKDTVWDYLRFGIKVSRYRRSLISSFACVAIGAFGTFVWQIGPIALYSAIIVGLLHNNEEIEYV